MFSILRLRPVVSAFVFTALASSIASAQNIIDGTTRNGGFESGSGSGSTRTFNLTADWFNFGDSDQLQTARREASAADITAGATGSFIGQINDRYDVVNATSDFDPAAFGSIVHSNKTAHVIASGEAFDFSLDWQDRFNWNDGLDEVRFVFFATDDDTLGGNLVWTSTHDSGISISQNGASANGDFQNFSGTSSLVTPTAVGQTLFVSMFGFQNDGSLSASTGFAGVDNVVVNVSAIPEPNTFALLGGLLALGFVMVRRRSA